jgi:hypothetical protein
MCNKLNSINLLANSTLKQRKKPLIGGYPLQFPLLLATCCQRKNDGYGVSTTPVDYVLLSFQLGLFDRIEKAMGVRFRKSVRLAKGVRINFSNRGASLSLGGRGASVNISKRGNYLNLGIPGSGLSQRIKISGPSNSQQRSSSNRSQRQISPERAYAQSVIRKHIGANGKINLAISVSNEGEILFKFTDTNEVITDKDVIKEIKRLPGVKEYLPAAKKIQGEIWQQMKSNSEAATGEFVNIYQLDPVVISKDEVIQELEELKPEKYIRQTFPEPKPTQETINKALDELADGEVSGPFKKHKKEKYIKENRESFEKDYYEKWQTRLKAFEKNEDETEARLNQQFQTQYEETKHSLESSLIDDEEVIADEIESWFSSLTIPVDMTAQFEYKDTTAFIDLDLPEIEDLPTTTTKTLKSGQVKIVDKSQKSLRQEYATCVLGLALFIASCIFNLNMNIESVMISGYTQRRNKQGDIEDDYIYSVKIPRYQILGEVIDNPIEDFNEFENRMKLSTTFLFKSIEPYEINTID